MRTLFLTPKTAEYGKPGQPPRPIKTHKFSDANLNLKTDPEQILLDKHDQERLKRQSPHVDIYEESEFIGKRWQYVWTNIVALIWEKDLQAKIQAIHDLCKARLADIGDNADPELRMDIITVEQIVLRATINEAAKLPETETGKDKVENLVPANIIIRFEFTKKNETALERKSEWDGVEWKSLPLHEITMRIPPKPDDSPILALASYTANLRAHPFTICIC
jgi:hypothetical protein